MKQHKSTITKFTEIAICHRIEKDGKIRYLLQIYVVTPAPRVTFAYASGSFNEFEECFTEAKKVNEKQT